MLHAATPNPLSGVATSSSRVSLGHRQRRVQAKSRDAECWHGRLKERAGPMHEGLAAAGGAARWLSWSGLLPGVSVTPQRGLFLSGKFEPQDLNIAEPCPMVAWLQPRLARQAHCCIVQRPRPAPDKARLLAQIQGRTALQPAHHPGFSGGETEARAGGATCFGVTPQLQEQKQTSSSPRPVLSYSLLSDCTTGRRQPPGFPFLLVFLHISGHPSEDEPWSSPADGDWLRKEGRGLLLTYW